MDCEREIERIEREAGIKVGSTKMVAAIESALGVLNAYSIATGMCLDSFSDRRSMATTSMPRGKGRLISVSSLW